MPSTDNNAQVESNKATVRRMIERLSAGDVAGFTDALAPDYVRHSQAMPSELQEIRGREMMHEWLLSNLVPFPDYKEKIEWLVGEGDFVAWRSRGTGRILPGANHLLLEAKVGSNSEMASLQRFVPDYATTVRDWLSRRVNGFQP